MKPARDIGWAVAVAILTVAIAVLHPWTIQRLDAPGTGAAKSFDASAFSQSIWPKVISATPVEASAATDKALFLSGKGRVVSVDTRSRIGVVLVDLAPVDGKVDVALQIGPVVNGTALREALGLGFGDFDTQMDYAAAADALNARAIAGIPASKDPAALNGHDITFTGAGARQPDDLIEIVPITLQLS
ncbi:MAG: periplasmic lipoprotein [Caulobacteraceae bacterium]|nr:periplasmic lipoprotein [Caulobacteraceae bacterium]